MWVEQAVYFQSLREIYEAYVIYCFMRYLLHFLGDEKKLVLRLATMPAYHGHHRPPFCCLMPWQMGHEFLRRCKAGVFQYVVIRFCLTILALSLHCLGWYDEGNYSLKSSFVWMTLVNCVSQTWALYSLLMFYHCSQKDLLTMRPFAKFMCIKVVIFFSWWQALAVSILVKYGHINDAHGHSAQQVATLIEDLLICMEMLVAAVAFLHSFPVSEYLIGANIAFDPFGPLDASIESGMALASPNRNKRSPNGAGGGLGLGLGSALGMGMSIGIAPVGKLLSAALTSSLARARVGVGVGSVGSGNHGGGGLEGMAMAVDCASDVADSGSDVSEEEGKEVEAEGEGCGEGLLRDPVGAPHSLLLLLSSDVPTDGALGSHAVAPDRRGLAGGHGCHLEPTAGIVVRTFGSHGLPVPPRAPPVSTNGSVFGGSGAYTAGAREGRVVGGMIGGVGRAIDAGQHIHSSPSLTISSASAQAHALAKLKKFRFSDADLCARGDDEAGSWAGSGLGDGVRGSLSFASSFVMGDPRKEMDVTAPRKPSALFRVRKQFVGAASEWGDGQSHGYSHGQAQGHAQGDFIGGVGAGPIAAGGMGEAGASGSQVHSHGQMHHSHSPYSRNHSTSGGSGSGGGGAGVSSASSSALSCVGTPSQSSASSMLQALWASTAPVELREDLQDLSSQVMEGFFVQPYAVVRKWLKGSLE